MPLLDFYNEKIFVSFPFEDNDEIPNAAFVDCNIVLGPLQPWNQEVDRVEVIDIVGDGFTLVVHLAASSDGPNGTVTSHFFFSFESTDPPFVTKWATSSLGAAYGVGYITAGRLSSYTDMSSGGPLIQRPLVQSLYNSQLVHIRVANTYDTLFVDEDCGIEDMSASLNYQVDSTSYDGDVILEPGRFLRVDAIQALNEFTFALDTNPLAGGTLPCDPVRILPDGYSENWEPGCSDLIYTFNGIAASAASHAFMLFGSRGISVSKAYESDNLTEIPNTLRVLVSPLTLLSPLPDDTSC